jgi:hypothetical protein
MGTKILQIVLLITATQFLFGSSCNKDGSKPCRDARYGFSVTSEFSPQKEIYNVGDTIFLTSTIPKTLTDLISNQQIDYSNNLGIGGTVGIGLIDSVNHKFEVGTDSFNFLSTNGNISIGSNKVLNISFAETSAGFLLKIKLIVNAKGNYIIGVSDLYSQGIKNQDCTNAGFSMFVNNNNKHFDILTNANIPGVTLDAQRISTNYCFRVQ